VKSTLVDTGPLVAFLNRRDLYHRWAVDTMARLAKLANVVEDCPTVHTASVPPLWV
jgi:hypothetical protein